MEKDTTYTVNRQELIRLARESCEGNLRPSGNGRFSQGLSKKGATIKKETGKKKDSITKLPRSTISKKTKVNGITEQDRKQMAIKSMLIRTIFASAVFLAIVVIDKFNFTYKTYDADVVKEVVQSNRVYDKAEKFFATLQDEKIVDVFNGLD